MNNKPKLIIDTDPGHDDALAILMTLLSDQFDVLAITTVAGNTTIEKVTRNAQAILDLIDFDIPVLSGIDKPLKRELVTAVVHGESGLAGFDTTATDFILTKNAPQKMIDLVNADPGEVTILALGPLTNVARAIQGDSDFAQNIKQLVMMGGAIDVPGNKNRVAEFNFFVDPEAADIVFRSNIPKMLVPLDACNKVVLQVEDFQKVENKNLKSILIPMMEHFIAGLTSDEGTTGILVYDALAAYYLLNAKAFTLKAMDVVIETKGEHTFGMSIAERRPHKVEKTNVEVVVGIDEQQFRQDFFNILSSKERS
jgi:inosine-uridine nucleoside N-ribohydrolase